MIGGFPSYYAQVVSYFASCLLVVCMSGTQEIDDFVLTSGICTKLRTHVMTS